MIRIVEHFRIHRILLLAIGLWPYNPSKFVKLRLLLFILITNSFIIFQFTSFITAECTADHILKVLSVMLFFLFCDVHYTSYWINAHILKGFVERLQHVYNDLKDENEIAIFNKYGNIADHITVIITSFTACSVLILSLLPLLPCILGTFLFANESHPLYNIIETEYFVDEEKTFYLTLLHTYASLYIGVTATVGGGLVVLTYIIHICGLFSIARYRMNQLLILNIHDKTNLKNNMDIDEKIARIVDFHCIAFELSEFYVSNFNGTYFCIILLVVICLSLNLYQVFQSVLHRTSVEESVFHLIFAVAIIIYSFVSNYAGQEVIDHYNDMFYVAYNIQWYTTPIRIQRLILFLLQRSCKIYCLRIGGLFNPSLECFASLFAASMSYFTMMYSTQK
ncbi:ObirOr5-9E47 [Ooceraea biroi]|uniref:Odorant receptor n=1 Tax=Ooceraea biroi TaxID=2015173 RepID=A0A3L8E0R1_OOCBI|nr:odorant receptor 24a [Ooceraea biroi]RLU25965.1 ObirOr5-9E47 [Ooceraea biroi]